MMNGVTEKIMANHKRGKPKNQRAGCLMCKPHKMNGYGHSKRPHKGLNKTGFGKLKDMFLSLIDLKDRD